MRMSLGAWPPRSSVISYTILTAFLVASGLAIGTPALGEDDDPPPIQVSGEVVTQEVEDVETTGGQTGDDIEQTPRKLPTDGAETNGSGDKVDGTSSGNQGGGGRVLPVSAGGDANTGGGGAGGGPVVGGSEDGSCVLTVVVDDNPGTLQVLAPMVVDTCTEQVSEEEPEPEVVIDRAALARQLYDRVVTVLPSPTLRVGPADLNSSGNVFVQDRSFWWIEEWEPISAQASAGSVWVSMTAMPVQLDVDPGVPGEGFSCDSAPAMGPEDRPESFDGCSYVYTKSSSVAPNSETWPAQATLVWHVTWTSDSGEGGDLGTTTTSSEVRQVPVAERQAVVTQ